MLKQFKNCIKKSKIDHFTEKVKQGGFSLQKTVFLNHLFFKKTYVYKTMFKIRF